MLDRLDDDNRVIHHDPDRQHQSEESQIVEREPHHEHHGERAHDPHGHGHERNDRRPPVLKEHQDDERHQHHRVQQCLEHLLDRLTDKRRGVVTDHVAETVGELFAHLGDFGFDDVGGVERVGIGELEDGQVGDRLAVDHAVGVLVLRPQLDMGHVPDPDEPAVRSLLDDDLLELFRINEAAQGRQSDLGLLALDRRRLSDLAGRHLEVLLPNRGDDVAGRHVPDRQLVGVEPDPHAVIALAEHPDFADARQPRELGLNADHRVVAQVELVEPAVGGVDPAGQQDVWRLLLGRDAGRLDHVGQERQWPGRRGSAPAPGPGSCRCRA